MKTKQRKQISLFENPNSEIDSLSVIKDPKIIIEISKKRYHEYFKYSIFYAIFLISWLLQDKLPVKPCFVWAQNIDLYAHQLKVWFHLPLFKKIMKANIS